MIEVQESELSKIHDTDTGKQSFYSCEYSNGEGYKVCLIHPCIYHH